MNIHLIAIGGAAMHNIALDLNLRHKVTGSDDEIYNPSRSRLEKEGLLPAKMGWFPDNITTELDAVILGMHAKKDNPELLKAQELGLKIYSYPEFVYEAAKDKMRVVIAGSHGKTTTTSMIMHVLHKLQEDFDYLVGANITGFDRMVRISDSQHIILEGDEYLSSPIDLRPKMLHYEPHISVITGIAWDHINVFPTEENYINQFEKFINSILPGGTVYYYQGDPKLQKLIDNNQRGDIFKIPYDQLDAQDCPEMSFFGAHNFQNMQAACLCLTQLGIPFSKSIPALQDFTGAQKRLQKIGNTDQNTAYIDFAHAPSKVKATTEAVKSKFPDRPLIAFLELHTFSSLNKKFTPHYNNSLAQADQAFVYYDPHTLKMKGMPVLEADYVSNCFNHPNLKIIQSGDAFRKELSAIPQAPSSLLFMSSGNFGKTVLSDELKRFFP